MTKLLSITSHRIGDIPTRGNLQRSSGSENQRGGISALGLASRGMSAPGRTVLFGLLLSLALPVCAQQRIGGGGGGGVGGGGGGGGGGGLGGARSTGSSSKAYPNAGSIGDAYFSMRRAGWDW